MAGSLGGWPQSMQELAVAIELGHPRAGVAVGDEEGAVGQPGDVGRPVEVVGPAAGHAALAHRPHQLPVVGEDVDDVLVVVDDPDVLLRIVGADQDLVRAAAGFAQARTARRRQQVVVLQPLLDGGAVAIDREHQVVAALLVEVVLARVVAAAGVGPPRRQQAGADPRRGAFGQLDFAALRHPDLVGTLGEDAGARTPGPAGVRLVASRAAAWASRRPPRSRPSAPAAPVVRPCSGRLARTRQGPAPAPSAPRDSPPPPRSPASERACCTPAKCRRPGDDALSAPSLSTSP